MTSSLISGFHRSTPGGIFWDLRGARNQRLWRTRLAMPQWVPIASSFDFAGKVLLIAILDLWRKSLTIPPPLSEKYNSSPYPTREAQNIHGGKLVGNPVFAKKNGAGPGKKFLEPNLNRIRSKYWLSRGNYVPISIHPIQGKLFHSSRRKNRKLSFLSFFTFRSEKLFIRKANTR